MAVIWIMREPWLKFFRRKKGDLNIRSDLGPYSSLLVSLISSNNYLKKMPRHGSYV